jgi:hypothetical protein
MSPVNAPLFYTCGWEYAQNVGRKTNLDARPTGQHKFLRLVIQKRRVPEAVGLTAQECHCLRCRIFPCLGTNTMALGVRSRQKKLNVFVYLCDV